MKKLFGAIVLVVALSGCGKQKEMALQKEVDSLRLEISVSRQMNATLQQIGRMIDSVDVLRTELLKGTNQDPDRLREINKYLALMQSRSSEIESELSKGTGAASVYSGLITKLQADLVTKTLEFNTLTEDVAALKGANDTLRMIVEQQTAEINQGTVVLATTKRELLRLDEEVKQLAAEAQRSDSYYERTLALEEIAKRTQLAIEKSKSL